MQFSIDRTQLAESAERRFREECNQDRLVGREIQEYLTAMGGSAVAPGAGTNPAVG